MAATGVDAFDTTVHKTNIWLKDIMEEMGWSDRHRAYLALRGVLHALRDRLTVKEAADLSAQLPMLVRGFYFDAWDPNRNPIKHDKESFLAALRGYFANEPQIDAEAVARTVFKVIARRVDEGEIEDIQGILPKELSELWENR
jgi:uncharacterized protein (DUF2267 family)